MNSVAIVIIIIVTYLGYIAKSLTFSGAVTAAIISSTIFLGLGIKGLALLGLFFLSSSAWSKYKKSDKKLIEEITEKGERRDYTQVIANGSLPALFSLLYWLNPSDLWIHAFCISIAASNSDTWASELGSLSTHPPIHILTLKQVQAGTSGAVSFLGILASILGALTISIPSVILFDNLSTFSLLIIAVSGVVGSVLDTVIGALWQVKYQCMQCNTLTEKKIHCNQSTLMVSGKSWLNNNITNFLSISLATCFGLFYYFLYVM